MGIEGRGKTALVTGASSGIGKAFAELLAARGYGLILIARRGDRLETLAAELRQKYQIPTHTIVADLAQPDASKHIVDELAAKGLAIDMLVNNAGYGQPGSYVNVTWPDHERFMQVMVTAVLDLTYRLLPGMIERKWGRIINVASVAGMVPSPAGHTLYGASKSFLIRFSEALQSENGANGVNVTAVCPGFTWSEFHDVTGTRDKMNKMPRMLWLKADDVAREGYEAVMNGHSVVVNGAIYRFVVWLNGALPRSLSRRVSTMMGRRYRKT
jgi:short-subunit dehydrogenase